MFQDRHTASAQWVQLVFHCLQGRCLWNMKRGKYFPLIFSCFLLFSAWGQSEVILMHLLANNAPLSHEPLRPLFLATVNSMYLLHALAKISKDMTSIAKRTPLPFGLPSLLLLLVQFDTPSCSVRRLGAY